MERAAQPPHEQLRSFDPLASIDMLRFDHQRFGQVLPETRQRIYDEELSGLSEGVNRAATTEFTLRSDGQNLLYFDKGEYKPYIGMLLRNREIAKLEAEVDPRKAFLAEWAVRDLQVGYRLLGLQVGQQMVWHSAYPYDVEQCHGAAFLKSCGLSPERKMSFVYRATRNDDGSLRLETQTLDGTDAQTDATAFAAVEAMATYDPHADLDTLVRAYDSTLVKKFGGHYYAGRRGASPQENAWAEITRHRDLVTYFLDGLERLAALEIPRTELRRAAEAHVYGVWKAFKNRLDGKTQPHAENWRNANPRLAAFQQERLNREVNAAFNEARANGEVKAGCGGSTSFGPDGQLTDPLATFQAIFGSKSGTSKETYKFDKKMYCVVCQAPPTASERKVEAKKLCGPCGICKTCDKKLQPKTSAKADFALTA